MNSHLELSDDIFEEQFETCKLDAVLFNHEAHLRLAWIHITKYGTDKALENVTSQLLAFAVSINAADKYNTTVSVAAIKIVNHFVSKSNTNNFTAFIEQFPRLKLNFKELIGCHYKLDIFKSELARQNYLEPDLLPFS